jgi:hypothetical protein
VIWLSWRLQRTETVLTAALVALLAALAVPSAIHLASLYVHDGIASCLAHPESGTCGYATGNFNEHAGVLRSLLGWLNLLIGLVGVALAVPLIQDLEQGTSTFAWTQGVTRGRWLATRLSLAVVTALAAAGVYSALLTWYRTPLDHVFGRFSDGSTFDVEGIVPFAYVLFALGLGLAVGVVWRRTAPAMVVAFLSYFGARIFVDTWLRQRFVTPRTATWGPHSTPLNFVRDWVLSESPSNRFGRPFTNFRALEHCAHVSPGGIKVLNPACIERAGANFTHVVYQPASRFWEFQGIEFVLFGGLALLLMAFAAWRVLRTD